MNDADRLRHLVVKFLRLETIAEALYRQHAHAVSLEVRPVFEHFATVEARHREIFERYYTTIYGLTLPTFHFSTFGARFIAEVLHLFGQGPILRFECWIERLAIADYTQALEWIEEPSMRKLIHDVLKDETQHLPFTEALLVFREDEEEHIQKMKKLLTSEL
jgi:rubrerythrin